MADNGEAVHVTVQVGTNTLMCQIAPLPHPATEQDGMDGLVVILQGLSPEMEAHQTRLETLASMAEELRTPLSTVIGYADLLLSEAMGGVAGVQRKFLLRIKADAERMIQLANDLSMEAGGEGEWNRPQHQSVDVNKLIEESVASAHTQLEIRALVVDLDLAAELPIIEADPDYLRRVLSGLLSNACMASPVGGRIHVLSAPADASPFDEMLAQSDGEFVTVSIRDQGGGFSDEVLSQVFERTRPTQTPPGLGESGPGLALIKNLVEAHGGHLWVESEKGVSTTFSFVLPVDKRNGQVLADPFVSERDQPTLVGTVAR
jgi:signal transduction histidine kinase